MQSDAQGEMIHVQQKVNDNHDDFLNPSGKLEIGLQSKGKSAHPYLSPAGSIQAQWAEEPSIEQVMLLLKQDRPEVQTCKVPAPQNSSQCL